MTSAQNLAGVYDVYGKELTHAHLKDHTAALLGDHLTKLAARHHKLVQTAATHADTLDHPAHAQAQKAEAELVEAAHGRLKGLWSIDRFDVPIEYYAAKIVGDGRSEADIDFHSLSDAIKVAADTAMKRDKKPIRTEFEDTFENLFLTVGVTAMWQEAIGTTIAANSGGGAAATYAFYNNLQARICVGDSATAALASQTWLIAASNKFCVGMDATYPTQSTNQAVFRATFTSANGNYAWQEFVIDNNNGSNATSTTQSGGSALDRVVSAQGTKAAGQTWQPSMTLTIS